MINEEYCPILRPDEIVNIAIMEEKLAIIVEGKDDFPIYDDLFRCKGLDLEIYVAEELSFETEKDETEEDELIASGGCYHVMRSITTIEDKSNISKENLKRYVLGIIDLDVRQYRCDLPKNELIFILDRYSIENYFVNIDSCKFLIKKYTNVPKSYLTDSWIDRYFENIKNTLIDDIFFIVVEAIRNAVLPKDSYENKGIIKFEPDSAERYINDPSIIQYLKDNKDNLERFCIEKSIQKSWESMLVICKGKWLLHWFLKIIKQDVDGNSFPNLCVAYKASYTGKKKSSFKSNGKLNLNEAINSLRNEVSLVAGLDKLFEKIDSIKMLNII